METNDWTKERDRNRRFVIRNGLISSMNNTKWIKLQNMMLSDNVIAPKFRFKCIREAVDVELYWDSDWQNHISPFEIIEWLEIDPLIRKSAYISEDLTDYYSELLDNNNIPYTLENRFIRITGYHYPIV